MSLAAPRILVISPNWIGDALMAQPLLTLLKRRDPAAAIDVLAPGWVAPVWRAMAEVDTVLEAPFKHGKLQLRARWKVARQLRRRGYAGAYVLPNTLKFALIPWLAGIPRRVGYLGEHRYGLLNVIHRDDPGAPRPMVSFYAALAEAPGRPAPPRPKLAIPAAASRDTLARFELDPGLSLIAFAPGAEFGSAKRWPAAHYAELARTIVEADAGAQIVLLGSPKDRPACVEIEQAAPGVRNLAGTTSLEQALALIAQARAVVSNDSGLMHVAAALGRPLLAIYGPTDPDHTPPTTDLAVILNLRLECAPCQQRECPLGHHRCMREISAAMAWQALQPMLG
jgi:heptosyltransferase-2